MHSQYQCESWVDTAAVFVEHALLVLAIMQAEEHLSMTICTAVSLKIAHRFGHTLCHILGLFCRVGWIELN